eukprot:1665890-Rhodomonas_salina.1
MEHRHLRSIPLFGGRFDGDEWLGQEALFDLVLVRGGSAGNMSLGTDALERAGYTSYEFLPEAHSEASYHHHFHRSEGSYQYPHQAVETPKRPERYRSRTLVLAAHGRKPCLCHACADNSMLAGLKSRKKRQKWPATRSMSSWRG